MATVPASSPVGRRENSLSGARADFVAQLGRRVGELRLGLQALEKEPESSRPRDDLKRRFHALGSAARVLKFQVLADELLRLEQVLLRSPAEKEVEPAKIAAMYADMDSLVSLAWGEAAPPSVPGSMAEAPATISWPATALVVGDALLAEALLPEIQVPGDTLLECERVEVTSEALEMARVFAPDVVVLDTELSGSQELIERLSHDPLTEPVPVIAVGTFSSPERAARWIALGVARVLARPFTPRQLQEACSSVLAIAHQPPRPEPLGQITLEQLAAKLGEELQRGLCDAALDQGKKLPIALGDGHEVMAALWSALVRIREVATLRSGGMVRFQHLGPEGAVAVASWNSEVRGGHWARNPEETPRRLDERTILVVDDDPSVTWFLAGVLKTAGAHVLEARDGEAALRLAQRHHPDLVISDILMPKLDGFALCRALKRDVVLRDAPVILLSWKEDLLQRVRELGANADGYLRKEASAAVILERVFEVLRPRMRVERRLQTGGEVRGRLEDLTVRTLLTQVIRLQPNARVSIRDAAFLYEMEIREGVPRSVTRTTPKGNFERGLGVIFNLLGVGAGRFIVTPSNTPLRGWLGGSLAEQIQPAVAQIRAAQRLLTGTELMGVQGVDLNLEALQPYLEASPSTTRDILDKLTEGFSPRALLLRGGYSARLLEDVLNDAILHGGVARIVGTGGDDLLPSAVEQELTFLETGFQAEVSEIPEAALYARITPSPLPAKILEEPWEEVGVAPAISAEEQEASSVAPLWRRSSEALSPMEQAWLQASPSPAKVMVQPFSSTESASPPPVLAELGLSPPLSEEILPSPTLTPRPGMFLRGEEGIALMLGTPLQVSVEEPGGIVRPEVSAQAPQVEEESLPQAATQASEEIATSGQEVQEETSDEESYHPPPVLAVEPDNVSRETFSTTELGSPAMLAMEPDNVSRETFSPLDPSPGPQMVAPREGNFKQQKREHRSSWGGVLGVLVLLVVGSFWALREDPGSVKSSAGEMGAKEASPRELAGSGVLPEQRVELTHVPSASAAPVERAAQLGIEDLPLDTEGSVPEGQGVLEVEADQREDLIVDRREIGRGPKARVILSQGIHELRSKRKGDEQSLTVVVRAGRKTRVDLRGTWRR